MGAVVVVAPADASVEGAVLVLVVCEADGGTVPGADVTSDMLWSVGDLSQELGVSHEVRNRVRG